MDYLARPSKFVAIIHEAVIEIGVKFLGGNETGPKGGTTF